MSDKNIYSDEFISAYIDGELDNDERARLLFDEQQDTELAQRINAARTLKEKVQLAFSDVANAKDTKRPFSCAAFANRHRALVASLFLLTTIISIITYNIIRNDSLIVAKQLIENTQVIPAKGISDAVGTNQRVVINISKYHPQNFSETIDHIETLLNDHKNDGFFNVEIVANGQGLKVLDTKTSTHAARLNQLAEQFNNLEVIACARSLAELASHGDTVQLMKSIIITPSAAQQVAKRTDEGWLYLKI
jgi:intracellular sulfur oxidation DsrE/DsrF family protein